MALWTTEPWRAWHLLHLLLQVHVSSQRPGREYLQGKVEVTTLVETSAIRYELQNPGSSGYVSHHPPCGFKLADLFWRQRLFDKRGRRFVITYTLFIFLFIFLATFPIHLRLEPCRSLPDSSVQNLPHLASLFWGYLIWGRYPVQKSSAQLVGRGPIRRIYLSKSMFGSVLLAPIQDAHNPQSRKFSSLMHFSCGSKTTRLRSNMIIKKKLMDAPLKHLCNIGTLINLALNLGKRP